jgi:hypothetical protein
MLCSESSFNGLGPARDGSKGGGLLPAVAFDHSCLNSDFYDRSLVSDDAERLASWGNQGFSERSLARPEQTPAILRAIWSSVYRRSECAQSGRP